MARTARVVIPGVPHHITQRGNRRMETFFGDEDRRAYLSTMAGWCGRCGVSVWSYCIMPNHVHLIAVPETEDGLRRAIGEAHRRYTLYINHQKDWKGHLWQDRFSSFPLDERHLLAALRYVELNPVKAGMVKRPEDYEWSSARAHLKGENDVLLTVEPVKSMVPDWRELLASGLSDKEYVTIRRHERTGRPLGSDAFLTRLEELTGRVLKRGKPGPKKSVS